MVGSGEYNVVLGSSEFVLSRPREAKRVYPTAWLSCERGRCKQIVLISGRIYEEAAWGDSSNYRRLLHDYSAAY